MQGGFYVPQQITPLGVPPWRLPHFIDELKWRKGPVPLINTGMETAAFASPVIIEHIGCYRTGDKSDHCFLEPDDLSVKGGYLYVTDTDEPFSGAIHLCDGTDEYENGSYKDRLLWICGDQCSADVAPKGAYVR